jgi:hypothetical protein
LTSVESSAFIPHDGEPLCKSNAIRKALINLALLIVEIREVREFAMKFAKFANLGEVKSGPLEAILVYIESSDFGFEGRRGHAELSCGT